MWVKVLKSIHGENGSMAEEDLKKMHSCTWRSILLKIQNLNKFNLNIPKLLQVSIGDGENTNFWGDKWHELGSFRITFPHLFALEKDKNVKAKDRLNSNVESWERRRPIREGRERTEMVKMEEAIKDQNLTTKRDKWMKKGAPNGDYTTEWFRDCMETFKTMGRTQQNFWNKWIPKKHNIFIWRLIRHRVPTRKKLTEMGIDVHSTLCPLCDSREE